MAPGDLIVAANAPAEIANQFEATVVWLADAPLLRGRSYALRIGAASANASINPLKYKINLSTLDRNAATTLVQKEIGVCNLQLDRAHAVRSVHDATATPAASCWSTSCRAPPWAPACCTSRCAAPRTSSGRRWT